MVHSINANNNPKLSKFVLYFHLGSVHAHIILWINDVDVDRITNEIIAMVLATIDEQSGKFILPDNEHDLTLFKLVERKQMHQCGSRCKTNKHIGTCKLQISHYYICRTTCSSTSNHAKVGQKNSNQV